MWFFKLIRQFFFSVDSVVYNFISVIYDLLISISRTSVLTQADIAKFSDRVYKLLVVFMVFKVTFSLITYIVNPDEFSDKNKGISKLGTNIIISLALLILTPYIFNYAYQLQAIVLESNAIGTLILGDENDKNSNDFSTAGDYISYVTMSAFFTPNLSFEELRDCYTVIDENGEFNKDCKAGLMELTNSNSNKNFEELTLNNYVAGVENNSLGLMFRSEAATATAKNARSGNKEQFVIEYKIIFSTVVGVVIILLLLTYCMDIAVRSIKLAFLQIAAPIPILSYVDPKSGKDGMFKKWYQMCFKTYLSLFMRLIALYFAIYVIGIVRNHHIVDIVDGSYQTDVFVTIFIIIGALMFAKQLPKILEGLGIKLDGDSKFTLNPLKKFEEGAIGGRRLTGMAGGVTAAAADRFSRIATAPGMKNKLKAIGGSPFGILGGAARGFSSNAGFVGGRDKQADVNRRLRDGRINGLSATRSYLDYYGSKFGMDDATLEREATITHKNRDAIDEVKREVDAKTQQNDLKVKSLNQSIAPIKSIQERRKNVQSSAKKLMDSAESIASKKGDLGQDKEAMKLVNYLKANKGHVNLAADIGIEGVKNGEVIDDEMIARAEIYANRKQYTSNRRAAAANVGFLKDHQGENLSNTLVIGNQVFSAGSVIDGQLIAEAEAAEGKYIKSSKKEVYNELSKDKDSGYESLSEYSAFQNDKDEYQNAKTVADDEIKTYNSTHSKSEQLTTFDDLEDQARKEAAAKGEDYTAYSDADLMDNTVTSSADTKAINNKIRTVTSEVEKLNRANEEIKNNATVEYMDESGKTTIYKMAEADNLNKAREDKNKREKEKHDQRRKFRQGMGIFPPGGSGKK